MKPLIIAEAATNHNGDLNIAKEMIHAAKESGADMVKFQSWQIKKMAPDNPTYEIMKPKELSDEDHFILIDECRKLNIGFITTCFDVDRVAFLSSLEIDTIKVASTDAGSFGMLKSLREKFSHIILSTGMSFKEEVENAVDILKTGEFSLLHCMSIYPTPPEQANLSRINWLRQFTENVGYSDHTFGNTAAKIAIAMGAKIIEKHFTLKRDPNNVFSNLSALPADLKDICHFAASYDTMLGVEDPDMTEDEKSAREQFIGRWGDNR